MKATEALKEEHKIIEKVLQVLERSARKLETGELVDPGIFEGALDFLKNFADRCHHYKEEEVLFPALEAKGLPREGGPTGVMLHEHEEGRGLIRAMGEALGGYKRGDGKAAKALAQAARRYTALLREHIPKENDILYPIADEALRMEDERLMERFDRVEEERMGKGAHERYHALVEELVKGAGLEEE